MSRKRRHQRKRNRQPNVPLVPSNANGHPATNVTPASGHPATQNSNAAAFKIEGYAGPVPSPQMLREYDDIVPGLADRLISVFEQQAKHRMGLEDKVVQDNSHRANLGLWFGFILGAMAILSAVGLSIAHLQVAGGILGGTGMVSLAAVFVYGSQQRKSEREGRRRAVTGGN